MPVRLHSSSMRYWLTGQTGTHQSPRIEEAEVAPEPEAHDGSQWWHGMFTRAGKMGTMASDICSDSTEHGKQVSRVLLCSLFPCSLTCYRACIIGMTFGRCKGAAGC